MNYKREAILLALTIGVIIRVWHWSVSEKMDRMNDTPIIKKAYTERTSKKETPPKNTDTAIAKLNIKFPVKGHNHQHIISFFGDPRDGGRRKHQGVDIVAPRGTKVIAVASGTVKSVKTGGAGGKQVWLLAENNWLYYYGHLHEQFVKEGQKIRKGDILGSVGNTGNARHASPHLHFEMHTPEKKIVNPLTYLATTNP